MICAQELTPHLFLADEADIDKKQRAVAFYLGRCCKLAEGYFYGHGVMLGTDGFLVAASSYFPELGTARERAKRMRFADVIASGQHVLVHAVRKTLTLVYFLLQQQHGQARYSSPLTLPSPPSAPLRPAPPHPTLITPNLSCVPA